MTGGEFNPFIKRKRGIKSAQTPLLAKLSMHVETSGPILVVNRECNDNIDNI